MRKTILFLLLSTCTVLLHAQPKGFKAVSDEADFRKKFAAAASTTQSIRADFTQEKNLSVLSEKINSKGTFLFKKPNMVRMEYTQPFKYLLVINKDKVTIRDEQKTNTFSAKSNKLFEHINKIIIDCVQGTAMDNKDFNVTAFESDKKYLLQLVPKKKELKEFFTGIRIYIEKKDYSVGKMDLEEPSGDNTLITFTNKQLNTPVPDAEFVVK